MWKLFILNLKTISENTQIKDNPSKSTYFYIFRPSLRDFVVSLQKKKIIIIW